MVERVQGAIIEKIQRLNQLRANASQYPATLKAIKELVVSFNNYELQRLDALDGADYTAHLLVHLIDGNDLVNAKFLYQRVPETISQQNQAFIKVWAAVMALS